MYSVPSSIIKPKDFNMRFSITLIFVSLLFQLVVGTTKVEGQTAKPTAIGRSNPDYLEWFITAGNWQTASRLYVRTLGTGRDTVVLLHGGWGGEHHYLMETVRGLESKYLFILYDQRGSLRSPFPEESISFNNHIDDLELIRKELKLSKLKIVAHSMGAMLAGGYHAKFPNRVKSITLLAPAYLKAPMSKADDNLVQASGQKVQALMNRPEVKTELSKLKLDDSRRLSSIEETNKFRINFAARFLYDVTLWRHLREGGPFYNQRIDNIVSQTMPAEGWDYFANFQRSKVPVTVILGDHDFLDMGAQLIRSWTKDIPNVNVTVIEKAGHDIWIDQPEKFKAALDLALKK
jgi:pimeloyl-ACP methyl ester carboxylesterase